MLIVPFPYFKEVFEDFIFFTLLQFQRNSVAFLHLYNVILTHNDWECVEIIGFFSCFFNVFYVLFVLFVVVEFLKNLLH